LKNAQCSEVYFFQIEVAQEGREQEHAEVKLEVFEANGEVKIELRR
jgi:hypothetical protein